MAIEREELRSWIFGAPQSRRFTQDSPVLPDVWLAYGKEPTSVQDLILTPHAESTAAELAGAISKEFDPERLEEARMAYNEGYVVVTLSFDEMLRAVLPLSQWWQRYLWPGRTQDLGAYVLRQRKKLAEQLGPKGEPNRSGGSRGTLAWFVGLVGLIAFEPSRDGDEAGAPADLAAAAARLLAGLKKPRVGERPALWAVNRNRPAETAVWRSRESVKADAATRLFEISCAQLRWAVIDSGIDATHPAFRRRDDKGKPAGAAFPGTPKQRTRVIASYDFTILRDLIAGQLPQDRLPRGWSDEDTAVVRERLRSGRFIDWSVLAHVLAIKQDKSYRAPTHEHGTHVAGILGGDWRESDSGFPGDHDLRGMCPDIELYDLRVFDDSGRGDEWSILGALQFIRHLNSHSDLLAIHGVNLSLSIAHDVENYACGRTPICDECERLMANGVCVVTAAGNEGRADYSTASGSAEGYRTVSITDPGNAERIITVGSTHRHEPHTYGVSYFSSRGPTGDGRYKPDLVAPGEKVKAPIPGEDFKAKDGTSQAAPHVSGAAALLMARHTELLGQPERVKQILCRTATDLGRERYFQGAGMVDALRALQSV